MSNKNYEGTITVHALMHLTFEEMDQIANAPTIKIKRKPKKDKNETK